MRLSPCRILFPVQKIDTSTLRVFYLKIPRTRDTAATIAGGGVEELLVFGVGQSTQNELLGKSKVFVKIIFHTTSAFFIGAETRMGFLLDAGVILLDKTDKKGRPNGATHAAYVKFPTIFSRFFLFM